VEQLHSVHYISSTGGSPGVNFGQPDTGGYNTGGAGGSSSGTGVTILGGQGGGSGWGASWPAVQYPAFNGANYCSGKGAGLGAGQGTDQTTGGAAKGITGSGGGAGAAGSQGCVIVEEIYGLY